MFNSAVELFDRFCEGFVDRNLEKVIGVFRDDAKFLAPVISEMSGKKTLTDFFERELPNIENYRIQKLATWEREDETVIEWKNNYRDKRTGISHQVGGVTIVRINNGLVQEMREYCNVPSQ